MVLGLDFTRGMEHSVVDADFNVNFPDRFIKIRGNFTVLLQA